MIASDLELPADVYAALRERVILEAERDRYRELAKAAIERIAEQQREIERQRRQLAALRDEVRTRNEAAAA